MVKIFLAVSIVLMMGASAYSQNLVGCAKSGTSIMYYPQNGNGTGINVIKPKYDNPFSTLTSSTSICPRFTQYTVVPLSACCIGTDCAANNQLYNFTNIPCPVDSNTIFLLLGMGGAGIFAIKRLALS